MSEKVGLSYTSQEKNGSVIYFLLKKGGPVIYQAVLKKGAIRHAHPYYAIYRKLPTPPPMINPLPITGINFHGPTLRKHAYSNVLKILPPENVNFQRKKSDIFSYFGSKHRLWELVRTASPRRF